MWNPNKANDQRTDDSHREFSFYDFFYRKRLYVGYMRLTKGSSFQTIQIQQDIMSSTNLRVSSHLGLGSTMMHWGLMVLMVGTVVQAADQRFCGKQLVLTLSMLCDEFPDLHYGAKKSSEFLRAILHTNTVIHLFSPIYSERLRQRLQHRWVASHDRSGSGIDYVHGFDGPAHGPTNGAATAKGSALDGHDVPARLRIQKQRFP